MSGATVAAARALMNRVAGDLTPEQLAELAAKTGLPADKVSEAVAAILPDVVNGLTPDGALPDHAEVAARTSSLQDMLAGLMPQR